MEEGRDTVGDVVQSEGEGGPYLGLVVKRLPGNVECG